ncbi:uncharacterized protein LOC115629234 [Scaptodrosophila lebanonensis]|uniref:Uncharacterized protein LOC115629234 n=1 Tax=Drosophila lebanonensis TaxID=7225 RepID=A0A6J2U2Z8_DROLE|nr:uncharacterized protein LOC115629234 [Scaptodrosophila lebanonensis]XP_030381508.1 uncharacterized protein LOC115629234 [Scaptodrosophila lebanonensis]
MASPIVVLIASFVHFGLRSSCFLNIERFTHIPGTAYAGHIAYCALLHFLYDMELMPTRYQRRMSWLAYFLIELVLGIAVMEVFALWLWCNVEHLCHLGLQHLLKRYGMTPQFYQEWEWAIMGTIMTALATLLWINAFEATNPSEKLRQQQETQKPQSAN